MFDVRRGLIGSLLTLLVCGGCSKEVVDPNRPAVFPVSGVVTYKQSPVEGATVLFVSTTPTSHSGATAVTDKNGRYQLRTYAPRDGAAAGSYKVAISKVDVHAFESRPDDDEASERDDESDDPPPHKSLLPAQYANPEKSGLEAQVSEGGDNVFDFDLQD